MPTPIDALVPADLTLDGVVAYWASTRPNEIALEFHSEHGWQRTTWAEFEALIQGVEQNLPVAVKDGVTVALVCDDSPSFHILLNALWRRGVAVLLLDRSWGIAIVEDLLQLTGAVLVYARNWGVVLSAGAAPCLDYPPLRDGRGRSEQYAPNLKAVAMYATTSGTTNNPKCVPISHERIRSAYRVCLTVHDFHDVRKAACLFQLNSLGILGVCFLMPREIGAATRIYPSFTIANIQRSWGDLLASDTDFVYLVPPLVRLLNALPALAIERGRKLRAFCSAAPVRQEELRKLENNYPVEVYNAYGLTELTFAVFFGCRAPDGRASDSIGYAVGIEACIVDEFGQNVLGAGSGELLIRGPMLTEGYLHNSAATAEMWDNGWLKTGDIAERDEYGRYFIRGRKKDVVFRGGFTYYLCELEHYLLRAEGVVDVCAFRGRDLPSGDELCVAVQVSRSMTSVEIMEWIRAQMGPTKVPNVVLLRNEPLPRNSNGKVMRSLIQKQYLEGSSD